MRQEISQVFTPRGSCHVPVLFSRCRPTGRNHTVRRHRSPPGELRRKSARRSREGLLASLSPSIKSRTTDLRYGLKLRVSRRTPKATTLFNWAPLDLTAGCLLIRPRRCQGQRSATIYELTCSPVKSAWHHISDRTGVRTDWSVSGSPVNREQSRTSNKPTSHESRHCEFDDKLAS